MRQISKAQFLLLQLLVYLLTFSFFFMITMMIYRMRVFVFMLGGDDSTFKVFACFSGVMFPCFNQFFFLLLCFPIKFLLLIRVFNYLFTLRYISLFLFVDFLFSSSAPPASLSLTIHYRLTSFFLSRFVAYRLVFTVFCTE